MLIFGLIGLGLYLHNTKIGLDELYLYGWHKAAGILAFCLILLRLIWRFVSPSPEVLGEPDWQSKAAHWVHRLFYLLMIA
ncbi:MAG: cytochrome b, partial [Rhodobacteraceae bacterium]|nr:cytochrome b [Paracoccaceae bacterium]